MSNHSFPATVTCTAATVLLLAAGAKAQRLPLVEYHGVTASQHQSQWDTLRPLGYRMLSLNVAGGRANQHYSAVWDRRTGPSFAAIHGLTRTEYMSWRRDRIDQGMRPQLVTASGSGSDEVFAAVWIEDAARWFDLVGGTREGFDLACAAAWQSGHRPVNAAAFGPSAAPQYNGVWVENTDGVTWGYTIGDGLAAYRQKFDALYEGHGRPAFVTVSDTQEYLSIWQDDEIGAWAVPSAMSAIQLDSELQSRAAQGFHPLCVQAGGSGSSARYTALLVTSEAVRARVMTRTGAGNPTFAAFDDFMEGRLRSYGARSGALAIAKDGRLVFARGYTWAESGYPLAQPTSYFRLASCTKPLTAMCVHEMDERGAITTNTPVNTFLGLNSSIANFDDITLAHMLQHTSGIRKSVSPFTVADAYGYPLMTVPLMLKTRWIAEHNLLFAPGAADEYSNLGYFLLGRVVEHASFKLFHRFLLEDVASRFGVSRIHLAGGLRSQLDPTEVFYFPDRLILEPCEQYSDRRLAPTAYSADYQFSDSSGGLATSAVDYVRMLTGAFDLSDEHLLLDPATVTRMLAQPLAPATHDLGGFGWSRLGNGVVAHAKGGSVVGSSTIVVYRSDRVSMAFFIAKSGAAHDADIQLNALANAVSDWGTADLFPYYGLPTFQRMIPHIVAATVDQQPNVTDDPFVLLGARFSGVTRVQFGPVTISGRSPSSWNAGWFDVISDGRMEIHPPQGHLPGVYDITLEDGVHTSNSVPVTLVHAPAAVLGAPMTAGSTFDLVAARGEHAAGSLALLTWSTSNAPSALHGLVSLGIGNGFTQLGIADTAIGFNAFTHVARWRLPGLRPGSGLYLQAVIVDPTQPLPLPATNVRIVRGQ